LGAVFSLGSAFFFAGALFFGFSSAGSSLSASVSAFFCKYSVESRERELRKIDTLEVLAFDFLGFSSSSAPSSSSSFLAAFLGALLAFGFSSSPSGFLALSGTSSGAT